MTIRQIQPLRRDEKGWFNHTIAIEDPFILTHNLADKLSLKSIYLEKKPILKDTILNRVGTHSSCVYLCSTTICFTTKRLGYSTS